jgi:hypothetical protein
MFFPIFFEVVATVVTARNIGAQIRIFGNATRDLLKFFESERWLSGKSENSDSQSGVPNYYTPSKNTSEPHSETDFLSKRKGLGRSNL